MNLEVRPPAALAALAGLRYFPTLEGKVPGENKTMFQDRTSLDGSKNLLEIEPPALAALASLQGLEAGACVSLSLSLPLSLSLSLYIYIYIFLPLSLYIYIYIYIHTYTYTYIQSYLYLHICTYIHLYASIRRRPPMPSYSHFKCFSLFQAIS